MVEADLGPFMASLGIVHGWRMDDRGWTTGVIDPMQPCQSANNVLSVNSGM